MAIIDAVRFARDIGKYVNKQAKLQVETNWDEHYADPKEQLLADLAMTFFTELHDLSDGDIFDILTFFEKDGPFAGTTIMHRDTKDDLTKLTGVLYVHSFKEHGNGDVPIFNVALSRGDKSEMLNWQRVSRE
ncbi:MAG: hypothetical protein ABI758_05545 [Candidatus Woesebacteria bacterium]